MTKENGFYKEAMLDLSPLPVVSEGVSRICMRA